MEKKWKGKGGYNKIMGYGIGILRLISVGALFWINNCIQFHSPKDFRARNHQVGDSPDFLFKQVQLIPFWSCFIQNQIACPLQNSKLHRIAFSLGIFFKIAARNYILFSSHILVHYDTLHGVYPPPFSCEVGTAEAKLGGSTDTKLREI